MFIKQQNIKIEIIYTTTYLKPNSSKPSMFQRNTAEKARFHSAQNLITKTKKQTIQPYESSSVRHGKSNWYPLRFPPFMQRGEFGCDARLAGPAVSTTVIILQGVMRRAQPLLLDCHCPALELRLEATESLLCHGHHTLISE